MKSEDQPGALQPGDAQAEIESEIATKHGAHRSAELHAMWSRWMLAALALLRSRPQIVAPDYDITLGDVGYSASLGSERPNVQLTVDAYAGDLMTHPDFLALAEFILSTPALATEIQRAGSLPSAVTQEELSALWRVGRVFLLEYLAIGDTLIFKRELFEHVYDRLEEYIFHSGPFPTAWLLHLQNVTLEPDRLELSDGLALRQVASHERVWLIKQYLRAPHMSLFYGDVRAVVEYMDMQEKWTSALQIPIPSFTAAQTVVLALRLLNSQPVGLSGYHWQPVNQPFVHFPRHVGSFNFNEPPRAYVGMPYVLTSSKADMLAALWPRVQRATGDDRLTVAFTRLADSYLRTKDEDRLIDYWTALESLFLQSLSLSGGGNQVQQGSLVAAALAHYIGADASERAGIANTMVDSHGLRGTIIHADKKKNWRPDKITELVTKTGEYLRAALRKRIQE